MRRTDDGAQESGRATHRLAPKIMTDLQSFGLRCFVPLSSRVCHLDLLTRFRKYVAARRGSLTLAQAGQKREQGPTAQ